MLLTLFKVSLKACIETYGMMYLHVIYRGDHLYFKHLLKIDLKTMAGQLSIRSMLSNFMY